MGDGGFVRRQGKRPRRASAEGLLAVALPGGDSRADRTRGAGAQIQAERKAVAELGLWAVS